MSFYLNVRFPFNMSTLFVLSCHLTLSCSSPMFRLLTGISQQITSLTKHLVDRPNPPLPLPASPSTSSSSSPLSSSSSSLPSSSSPSSFKQKSASTRPNQPNSLRTIKTSARKVRIYLRQFCQTNMFDDIRAVSCNHCSTHQSSISNLILPFCRRCLYH